MKLNLAVIHPGLLLVMVVGFVLWWPIGIIILGYILWSQSMGRINGHWLDRVKSALGLRSGNAAFAAHKEAVLRGLEAQRQKLADDERAFAVYLDKLKMARDKAAFDDFLKQRRKA